MSYSIIAFPTVEFHNSYFAHGEFLHIVDSGKILTFPPFLVPSAMLPFISSPPSEQEKVNLFASYLAFIPPYIDEFLTKNYPSDYWNSSRKLGFYVYVLSLASRDGLLKLLGLLHVSLVSVLDMPNLHDSSTNNLFPRYPDLHLLRPDTSVLTLAEFIAKVLEVCSPDNVDFSFQRDF